MIPNCPSSNRSCRIWAIPPNFPAEFFTSMVRRFFQIIFLSRFWTNQISECYCVFLKFFKYFSRNNFDSSPATGSVPRGGLRQQALLRNSRLHLPAIRYHLINNQRNYSNLTFFVSMFRYRWSSFTGFLVKFLERQLFFFGW